MIIGSSVPKREVVQFEEIQIALKPHTDTGIEVRLVASPGGDDVSLWVMSGGAPIIVYPQQLNGLIGALITARRILDEPRWWENHPGGTHTVKFGDLEE